MDQESFSRDEEGGCTLSRQEWIEKMEEYDPLNPKNDERKNRMFEFLREGYWEGRLNESGDDQND